MNELTTVKELLMQRWTMKLAGGAAPTVLGRRQPITTFLLIVTRVLSELVACFKMRHSSPVGRRLWQSKGSDHGVVLQHRSFHFSRSSAHSRGTKTRPVQLGAHWNIASRSPLCQSGRLAAICPWLGTDQGNAEQVFELRPRCPTTVQSDRVEGQNQGASCQLQPVPTNWCGSGVVIVSPSAVRPASEAGSLEREIGRYYLALARRLHGQRLEYLGIRSKGRAGSL